MKVIIVNRFDELSYIDAVQEMGKYLDVKAVKDDVNVTDEDEVVSINPLFKINYVKNLREALIKLDLKIFEISDKELENRTLNYIIE